VYEAIDEIAPRFASEEAQRYSGSTTEEEECAASSPVHCDVVVPSGGCGCDFPIRQSGDGSVIVGDEYPVALYVCEVGVHFIRFLHRLFGDFTLHIDHFVESHQRIHRMGQNKIRDGFEP
jgi:hypothetical protein